VAGRTGRLGNRKPRPSPCCLGPAGRPTKDIMVEYSEFRRGRGREGGLPQPRHGSAPPLLTASASVVLGPALVAEFAGRRLGVALHVADGRPVGAVVIPMPCVAALLPTICSHVAPSLPLAAAASASRLAAIAGSDTSRTSSFFGAGSDSRLWKDSDFRHFLHSFVSHRAF
jgi:hypothetical protein